MNEQNNNVNNGVAPVQPTQPVDNAQVQQPVQNTVPVAPVQPAVAPQPVVTTEVPVTQPAPVAQPVAEAPTQPAASAPIVEVATQPVTSAPVTEAPTQPVTQAPVVATEVPVAQPVTEVPTQPATQAPAVEVATQPITSAPVTEAPTQPVTQAPVVATEAPVVQTTPDAQPVVATEVATQPVQTDIVQQEALNPLANEPVQPQAVNTGTIAPTAPLQPATPVSGAINSNGVGFVAASAPPKKKANKPLIIGIVIVVIAALAALGYFVIYPFIMNKLTDPKTVYETAIRETFKSMNETVTEVVHDKAIYDLSLYLDSNMEFLQSYTGYTYNLNVGIDPTSEAIQAGFSIKDSTNAGHGYNTYLKDGKEYVRYSTHQRELIYVGEADLTEAGEIFGSFQKMISTSKKANSEDINYILNKVSELLISSLDESKLSKEEASIVVNKETIKVVNNKYQIDKTTAKNTIMTVYDGLKADEKAMTILSQILATDEGPLDEDTLKEMLTYTEDEDTENDDTILTMSIYTSTGFSPTLVGYALKTNQSDSEIHYYTVENYYEFKLYSVEKNIETNKDEKNTILISGVTANGKTTVNIVHADDEAETTLATLTIKDWTDTLKEFDYVINLDEKNKITGSVKYTTEISENMNKYGLDVSFKMGEDYINVVLNFSEDWTSEVAKININEAVTKSDDQIAEIHSEFMNILLSTPIGELFQTVSGDANEDTFDYYYEIDTPDNEDSVDQDEYYYDDDSIINIG